MITASVLATCGDLLVQRSDAKEVDWERAGRRALWFATGSAIPGHFWYTNIDRIIRTPGIRGLLMKVVLEEIVFVPPLHA